MRGLNDEHVVGFGGIAGLVFGEQHLVQFFSRPNSDALDLAVRRDGLSDIEQLHAGNFGHEDFAAMHLLQAADHETNALIERDPEAGHARVRQSDFAALALLHEDRHYATAAADNVAIANATESRVLCAGIGVRLHKHLFRTKFGGAIEIDGIDSFVRAERTNSPDAAIDRRFDHVLPTIDIGLNCFERVVLAGWNLFERGGVNDYRHAGKGALQALLVANIAEKIAQAGMIDSRGAHFMLLQFIAAEDDEFLRPILIQHDLHKLFAERSCASCDQHNLFRPVHLHLDA